MNLQMGDVIPYIASPADGQKYDVKGDLTGNVARQNADGTVDLLILDSAGTPFGAKSIAVATAATPGQCKNVLLSSGYAAPVMT